MSSCIHNHADLMALESQERVEIHNQTGLLRDHTLEKGQYPIKNQLTTNLFVKIAAQSF